MGDWIKTNPECLRLKQEIGVDLSLTVNPMDDALISGHIFLICNELFLTIQYEIDNKQQVKFAKECLNAFGVNDKNMKDSETLNVKSMIEFIQKLLKDNLLEIYVSDEYKVHQEILFVVKNK